MTRKRSKNEHEATVDFAHLCDIEVTGYVGGDGAEDIEFHVAHIDRTGWMSEVVLKGDDAIRGHLRRLGFDVSDLEAKAADALVQAAMNAYEDARDRAIDHAYQQWKDRRYDEKDVA
jgi:hypothetical protein